VRSRDQSIGSPFSHRRRVLWHHLQTWLVHAPSPCKDPSG
jgi:hypothetical protein